MIFFKDTIGTIYLTIEEMEKIHAWWNDIQYGEIYAQLQETKRMLEDNKKECEHEWFSDPVKSEADDIFINREVCKKCWKINYEKPLAEE